MPQKSTECHRNWCKTVQFFDCNSSWYTSAGQEAQSKTVIVCKRIPWSSIAHRILWARLVLCDAGLTQAPDGKCSTKRVWCLLSLVVTTRLWGASSGDCFPPTPRPQLVNYKFCGVARDWLMQADPPSQNLFVPSNGSAAILSCHVLR